MCAVFFCIYLSYISYVLIDYCLLLRRNKRARDLDSEMVRSLELENKNISAGESVGGRGSEELPGLVSKYLIKKAWSKKNPEPLGQEDSSEKEDPLEIDEQKDIQKQRNQDLLMEDRENSAQPKDSIENHVGQPPSGHDS